MGKLKLALYWAAACGGCDVAVLDTHEKILEIGKLCDIVLWPIATDFKYHHVEEMADGAIDVCLFNGAVRNSENKHLAELLRRKSKVMVAFGSCAMMGGIPGLANLFGREDILNRVYKETPSTDNPDSILPQEKLAVPEGEITLPRFFKSVYSLNQVVDVDYYVPGCPPAPERIWEVIQAIVSGQLPPKGSVVGATDKTVCDECQRRKEEKKVREFKRLAHYTPDRERCLLEQGVLCMGSVTRGGCGVRCPNSNMPCRGCYGPPPKILDQGAKFISTIGSVMEAMDAAEAERMVDQIIDPAGTFYRFGIPTSLLRRARGV